MINRRQDLTDEYEERYQKFTEMRNKWPHITNSNRSHYFEVIAKELKVTPGILYSKKYEGRWQNDQNKKTSNHCNG